MRPYFALGVIVNTHNIKGELRLIPYYKTFPFKKIKKLYIKHFGQFLSFEVEKTRPHKKFILLKFVGYDKIDEVMMFKSDTLFVEKKKAPSLGKDTYYWEEIIGCTLYNHRKEAYGKVQDILPSGGYPIYVVDTGKSYEKMVPAAPEFIQKVNFRKKAIYLTESALSVLE
jgi:16S rRNA processing protein RimM